MILFKQRKVAKHLARDNGTNTSEKLRGYALVIPCTQRKVAKHLARDNGADTSEKLRGYAPHFARVQAGLVHSWPMLSATPWICVYALTHWS